MTGKIGKEVKPLAKFSTADKELLNNSLKEVEHLTEVIVGLREDNAELTNELMKADERTMEYIRDINNLKLEKDKLKDDVILITKAFCLVK